MRWLNALSWEMPFGEYTKLKAGRSDVADRIVCKECGKKGAWEQGANIRAGALDGVTDDDVINIDDDAFKNNPEPPSLKPEAGMSKD